MSDRQVDKAEPNSSSHESNPDNSVEQELVTESLKSVLTEILKEKLGLEDTQESDDRIREFISKLGLELKTTQEVRTILDIIAETLDLSEDLRNKKTLSEKHDRSSYPNTSDEHELAIENLASALIYRLKDKLNLRDNDIPDQRIRSFILKLQLEQKAYEEVHPLFEIIAATLELSEDLRNKKISSEQSDTSSAQDKVTSPDTSSESEKVQPLKEDGWGDPKSFTFLYTKGDIEKYVPKDFKDAEGSCTYLLSKWLEKVDENNRYSAIFDAFKKLPAKTKNKQSMVNLSGSNEPRSLAMGIVMEFKSYGMDNSEYKNLGVEEGSKFLSLLALLIAVIAPKIDSDNRKLLEALMRYYANNTK